MKAPNRLRMLPAVVLFAGLVLTPSFVSKSPAQDPDESESLVQRGFAINPVPLNLDGKNRALVPFPPLPRRLCRRILGVGRKRQTQNRDRKGAGGP